jgi:RNA polymerase sigma-70 factor, ECF subfamily
VSAAETEAPGGPGRSGLLGRSGPAPIYGGDPRRLNAALAADYRLVWRTVRGLGLGPDEADDVVQQAFLVLARRLSEVDAGKERAFLVQTAIRVAANHRRSRRRQSVASALSDYPEGEGLDPERLVELKQRGAVLSHVLDQLPLELRSIFVLFELEQLTSQEIGALLGLPRGTVVSRLRRARDQFSRCVNSMRDHLAKGSPTKGSPP